MYAPKLLVSSVPSVMESSTYEFEAVVAILNETFYLDFKFNCVVGKLIPGLPDGLFSNQKFQFGHHLKGLKMVKY
jgi:hypothetical protein